jgi:hypothetical protein
MHTEAQADLRVNSLLLTKIGLCQQILIKSSCFMRAYGRKQLLYCALCGRELGLNML